MPKIIFSKRSCIGAGECAVLSPGLWKMRGDGKPDLSGAKENNKGEYILEISEEEAGRQLKVAGSCPSGCIRIER